MPCIIAQDVTTERLDVLLRDNREVIFSASPVHPGFTGGLTLELTNVGEIPIEIEPGMTICQLFLYTVDSRSPEIDKSPFAYSRRPSFGEIKLDDVAKKLARAR
jgi:dCTP deaminase